MMNSTNNNSPTNETDSTPTGNRKRTFLEARTPDRGDALGWALVLIWAGIVLLMDTTSIADNFDQWNGWSVFFTGFGVLAFLVISIRSLVTEFPSPSVWDVIFTLMMLGLGQGEKIEWIWPILPFAVGVMIIYGVITGKDRSLNTAK